MQQSTAVLADAIVRHIARSSTPIPANLLCGLAFTVLAQLGARKTVEEQLLKARNGAYSAPWKDDDATANKRPMQGGDIPERMKEKTATSDKLRIETNRRILARAHRTASKYNQQRDHGEDHMLYTGIMPDFKRGDDIHTVNCAFCTTVVDIITSSLCQFIDGYFSTKDKTSTQVLNGQSFTVRHSGGKRLPIIKTGRLCQKCLGNPIGGTNKYDGIHGEKVIAVLADADFRHRQDDDPQWADRVVITKDGLDGEHENMTVEGKMGFETQTTFASSLSRNPDWMGRSGRVKHPGSKLKSEEQREQQEQRFKVAVANARAKVKHLRNTNRISEADHLHNEIESILAARRERTK